MEIPFVSSSDNFDMADPRTPFGGIVISAGLVATDYTPALIAVELGFSPMVGNALVVQVTNAGD